MKTTASPAPQTITLRYPIEGDGQTIPSLTLRPPKVKDLLAVDNQGSSAQMEALLLANLAEVTPATIQELELVDYLQLQTAYTTFLD